MKTKISKQKIISYIIVFILAISYSCTGSPSQSSSTNDENLAELEPTAAEDPIEEDNQEQISDSEDTDSQEQDELRELEEAALKEENLRIFDQFIQDLKNGEPETIVGLWVENVLALEVVYQPSNNPGYISSIDDIATYFLYPWKNAGNHGLLAHNYLAGRYFFDVRIGDIITLVFGDGNYMDFEVTDIKEYQALQPQSPYSDFINLDTGEQETAKSLFIDVYMGDFHTTLQTCIANGAETEWGRQFTLAPPL